MIENEIRAERGGPTKVHFRAVINYGDDFALEFPTDRIFFNLEDGKEFCTSDKWIETRKGIVKKFRAINGTAVGTPYRWSLLQYTPVKIDGKPV